MTANGAPQRTILILLDEPHAWVAAATLARQAPPGAVETLIAPVPGVRFLSAQGRQGSELDAWWQRMATAPGRPVVLAAHEDDLPQWIPGLDADFIIAVPDDETLGVYRSLANVVASVDDDPRTLAELALGGPGPAPRPAPPQEPPPAYAARAERPAWDRSGVPPRPAPFDQRLASAPPQASVPVPVPGQARTGLDYPGLSRPAPSWAPAARGPEPPPADRAPNGAMSGNSLTAKLPVERKPQNGIARETAPPPERPVPERAPFVDPFDLLTRAEPVEPGRPPAAAQANGYGGDHAAPSRRSILGDEAPRMTAAPAEARPRQAPARSSFDPRQILDRLGQGRRAPVGTELGQAVLACKPVVVAVVSRKGGVGKTASAAAVAAILGEAVDPFGHTAALVDANIGNPDAWGRLEARGQPLTVRDVVRSLMAGMEPPSPAFAETPALAVYPESRDAGDGYAPAQIQRAAAYFKMRHASVVVDLPNRLPAFTSADAAVAAAWIGQADVLVLPTTADPTALLGAIEYLDADSVQGKPIVVSYIVPKVRQIRDAPQVRGMLDRIRASVTAVVEVPDDDRATLALIQRVAITEVSGELRQAYMSLATRVVEAAASRNGGGWA